MERAIRKIKRIFTAWYLVLKGDNTPLSKLRMNHCLACPSRKGIVCGICLCPLVAKTRLIDEDCPLKKW